MQKILQYFKNIYLFFSDDFAHNYIKFHYVTWRNFILWSPFFISIGIVHTIFLNGQNFVKTPIFILTFSLSIISFIALFTFSKLNIKKIFGCIFYATFMIILGIFATHLSFIHNTTYMLDDKINCTLSGEIESVRQIKNLDKGYYSNKVIVKNVKILNVNFINKKNINHNISIHSIDHHKTNNIKKITLISDQTLHIGDAIQANVTLKPIKNTVFSPNAKITNYFSKISATGSLRNKANKNSENNSSKNENQESIKITHNNNNNIDTLRLYIHKNFIKLLGYINGGLASAITTGILDNTFHIREAFSKSGLAHILAISGLHMSIIAALIFFLFCRILSIFFPIYSYKIAGILSILITFLYTILSYGSISTVRSFLMSTTILISMIFYRKTVSLSSVMLTASIMILVNPHFIFHPSFLLSFSAVISLISYFSSEKNTSKLQKNFYDKVILLFNSSLISSIATAPYTLFFFHSISIYGIFSNIIAIPLVTFLVLPLSILTIFLMPIQEIPFTCGILNLSISSLIYIAKNFAALPQIDFSLFTITTKNIFYITFGGLIIFLNQKNYLKYAGLIPILLNLPYSKDIAKIKINESKNIITFNVYSQHFRQKIRMSKKEKYYNLYEDYNTKITVENNKLKIYSRNKKNNQFFEKHSLNLTHKNQLLFINNNSIREQKS